MTDSPKSENIPSRFSTPVNELDDHRLQPESLPRTEFVLPVVPGRPSVRRQTRRSTNGETPGFLSARDAFRQGVHNRDFEHAVEDDEKVDVHGDNSGEGHDAGSNSPAVGRRSTFRRPRNTEDNPNKSRTSIESDSSTSPPHSVEAFAERRQQRGRSGTAESHAPSFITLHRSTSRTAPRDRARTFSGEHANRDEVDGNSSEGSVEDDVCFPQLEESHKGLFTIDYDELDEFVLKNKYTANVPTPFGNKPSVKNEEQGRRFFDDLSGNNTPDKKLDRKISGPLVDGDSSGDDEKYVDEEAFGPTKGQHEPTNRWSFFSSDIEEMIHAPELRDLLMPGETFRNLFELGPEGGVWWLDMLMPSEEEVETICKAFGIHGLTREDIVQQETREKVELFKSYYFVCFRSFYQMDETSDCYMEPVNVYAVVFREGILTFTFCPSPHAANVRKRMGKLREYVSLGSDWICYALIDDIVDTFGPVIHKVELESEAIEDNVFTARPEDSRVILRQIGDCRKTVMSLIRLLGGKADVIKGFAKRCTEQYSIAPRQDVGLYLSDIQDHVVTMMSNLGHFEKMLSRSHANYLAQISVDSILQGNRANAVLQKVTFIATILVPLNLVTGMFGMNVPVPGKDATSLGWWFGILGFLILFVATAFGVAKRFKYL